MKAGWPITSLGNEIDLLAGFAFKSARYTNDDEAIRLLRGDNIVQGCLRWDDVKKWPADDVASFDNYQLRDGDVVLAMDRPWVKAGLKHAMISADDLPCLLVQRTARLRPTKSLDNRFLMYLVGSDDFTRHTLGVQTGIGVPHISGQQIKDFQFRMPPLSEQRRIVGILDEAFEGLATAKATAEQNLQNARALFESHLQAVFTQRGDGWVEKKLGDIGKVSMCKRIFKDQTTATGDIPFYKIGTFGKEADAFIPNHIYDEFREKFSFPKKGDVLISAAGTIGRRVRYDGQPAYFQDSNIVWIENDETQVLNHYLYHFYGACEWNSTNGATISRLYNDNLKQIAIAFPKLVAAQRQIVATLDSLSEETQRLESLYQRKLAALDELKKSLLHRAFSGEL